MSEVKQYIPVRLFSKADITNTGTQYLPVFNYVKTY